VRVCSKNGSDSCWSLSYAASAQVAHEPLARSCACDHDHALEYRPHDDESEIDERNDVDDVRVVVPDAAVDRDLGEQRPRQ